MVPLARHLLRARDRVDSRYADPLDLEALAGEANAGYRWRIVQPTEYDEKSAKEFSG